MIKSIQITNPQGEILTLELRSPEKSGFFVRSIDGLGPCKTTVNTTESPYIDGSYFNSARVSERNIVLDLGFYELYQTSIETIRQQSYRFFPLKKPIEVVVETDNRVGYTYGYVETNEPDIFSKDSGTQISLVCPESYFLGTEIIQTIFNGSNPMFEFPFENPSLTLPLIEFGTVFIGTQSTLQYTGDEPTGVVIYIDFLGPVNDLAVHNASLGQTIAIDSAKLIALTGSDFVAGDFVIISTLKRAKSVILIRNGVEINLLNTLGTNVNWFTLERGANVFYYTADSGVANMEFLIEHQILYQGL